ncbi:MAG: glycosyltransferase [Acidimicrobiales bacterium]
MSRRQRILIASHEASRSGVPRVTVHLTKALRSAGFETVVSQRWGGPLFDEMVAAADRSFLEPLAKVRVALLRSPRTRPIAQRIGDLAVARVVKRERPDLVVCNSVMTTRYARAARSLGIPVMVYSHEAPDVVAHVLANLGASSWPADPSFTLVGCSVDTAAEFAGVLQTEPERVDVLTSPVDIAAITAEAATSPAPAVDGPYVLGCGRGNDHKGIDVFNAAAEMAREAGRPETWVWVGNVPSDRRTPAVTYVGEQPSVTPWTAAASVMALPSRADRFPLVVLEAMALGRPVVASDLTGPREQLGDTGVFVPAGDAPALLDAVSALVDDPATAERLGAAAAERAASMWDAPVFAARATALVERALGLQ